jgi:hypothetical protein
MQSTTCKRMKATVIGLLMGLSVGCSTVPSGPTATVYPPKGVDLVQYQADREACKHYAAEDVKAGQVAVPSAVTDAAWGGLLAAGSGAVIGAVTGGAARGAAIGATTGAAGGASSGAVRDRSNPGLQRQYDQAYLVCMASKQYQVPGAPLAGR